MFISPATRALPDSADLHSMPWPQETSCPGQRCFKPWNGCNHRLTQIWLHVLCNRGDKKKGRKEPKVAQEFSSKHEEHQVRAVSPLEMPSHFSSASHRWHYMKRAIKLNHRVAITGLLICELSPPPQRNPNLPVQWMYTRGHCRALRSRAHVSRGSGPKGWRTSHSTWPHIALFPAAFTQHKMVAGGRRTRWSKSVAHMCCSHYSLSLCTASIFQSYRLGSQETAQCLQQWDQVTKFRVGENY